MTGKIQQRNHSDGTVRRHRLLLEIVPGDFFRFVPFGGDVYILKFILPDWDDTRSISILSSIRAAMSPSARLLTLEIVVPTRYRPHIGPLIDLTVMLMTGGCERTEAEYGDLLSEFGICLKHILATTESPFSVIETVP